MYIMTQGQINIFILHQIVVAREKKKDTTVRWFNGLPYSIKKARGLYYVYEEADCLDWEHCNYIFYTTTDYISCNYVIDLFNLLWLITKMKYIEIGTWVN